MLKLVGTLLILGGIFGVLQAWNTSEKARLQQMDALIFFLEKAKYRMETEKLPIPQLLEDFVLQREKTEAIAITFTYICDELRKNLAPSPEKLWREAFGLQKNIWNLPNDFWEMALDIGKGLFGTNLRENIEVLVTIQEEMKKQRQQEQGKWKEKQKVFTPVGILAGCMVVIILL